MDLRQEIERRIRERAVRVDERLALLNLLLNSDTEREVVDRRDAILERVRRAAQSVRETLP